MVSVLGLQSLSYRFNSYLTLSYGRKGNLITPRIKTKAKTKERIKIPPLARFFFFLLLLVKAKSKGKKQNRLRREGRGKRLFFLIANMLKLVNSLLLSRSGCKPLRVQVSLFVIRFKYSVKPFSCIVILI